MKTITQDNITYKYCYVKTRGTSWAYGYYPETQLIEAKAKKKKPTERKIYERKCDELWSKIIHMKFNKCMISGKTKAEVTLHAHHIITKGSNKRLRWEIDNGILLSAYCHKFAEFAPHQSPVLFRKKMVELGYGGWLELVDGMSRDLTDKLNMKDVYEGLKIEYDKLRM
jgi:hypothetical protein